ncbi:MAG: glycosyltransferase [Syntrophobacteraceae bacterium]
MRRNQIVFWQENPSPHQAPWIRELAAILTDGQVTGVFHGNLTSERRALGWLPPDYGKARVLISPDPSTVEKLLWSDPERTVHLFSSVVHNARLNAAIRRALSTKALVGILSEGRDWRGLFGLVRRVHSIFNERSMCDRISFVLAMGHLAARWHRTCGYLQEKIFPFCYVVENHGAASIDCSNMPGVTLCFIGQLIKRKRVDLLIHSLSEVNSRDWVLRVIGNGKEKFGLAKLVDCLGLANMIDFTGVLDNMSARRQLAKSDLFVLPSHWDGWGAVVNEALMCGVPVICSDYCGAADLIHKGFNGELFRCDSRKYLTGVLEKWISKGPLNDTKREQIKSWSRYIEGDIVAKYFMEIIEYVDNGGGLRPQAPWFAGMPADYSTLLQVD